MRVLLFLLLLLPIGNFQTHAQKAAKGPWRVTYQRVRARPEDAGDGWGYSRDTTTTWQTRRVLQKAAWNVTPDSIRLFLNCDNPLLAPTVKSQTRFTATGATLRLDAKQGLLWMFATSPTVVLRAFRGKAQVFIHEFQAVAPPPPILQAYPGGRLATSKGGPPKRVRIMSMKAIPNKFFVEFMPDEARYRVSKYSVTLLRGEQAVAGPLLITQSSYSYDELETLAKPGDRFKVEIQEVQRQNSRGQVEQVDLTKQFLFPWPTD